jgi:transposase
MQLWINLKYREPARPKCCLMSHHVIFSFCQFSFGRFHKDAACPCSHSLWLVLYCLLDEFFLITCHRDTQIGAHAQCRVFLWSCHVGSVVKIIQKIKINSLTCSKKLTTITLSESTGVIEMDAREQRGLAIVQTQKQKIKKKGEAWIVPSQSISGDKYTVFPDASNPHCTCPDHLDGGHVCKHIHAVFTLIRMTQEKNQDGSTTTTTEALTVIKTVAEKKTYPQDWPKYNAAQCNERRHFHELLSELCALVPEPQKDRKKGGRPSISLRDGLFAACLKVYSLMSARRFDGELEEAYERGFISCKPHFNYALGVLDREETMPILKDMIVTSALPLRTVETMFAIDSTGFATTKYSSWYDKKYNGTKEEQVWVKAHFVTGVKTNIVPAVFIGLRDAPDSPQFPGLTHKTAENFTIDEMSADKAYAAQANFEAVEAHGGKFFPMFKSSATGGIGGAYQKAFHYFALHQEEYLKRYHLRSNVESTVSMVKRKFGDKVNAKNDTAQKNETYAKFVCHNLCVLVQEMYVQGIDPTAFGTKKEVTCTKTDDAARILRFPGW